MVLEKENKFSDNASVVAVVQIVSRRTVGWKVGNKKIVRQ